MNRLNHYQKQESLLWKKKRSKLTRCLSFHQAGYKKWIPAKSVLNLLVNFLNLINLIKQLKTHINSPKMKQLRYHCRIGESFQNRYKHKLIECQYRKHSQMLMLMMMMKAFSIIIAWIYSQGLTTKELLVVHKTINSVHLTMLKAICNKTNLNLFFNRKEIHKWLIIDERKQLKNVKKTLQSYNLNVLNCK